MARDPEQEPLIPGQNGTNDSREAHNNDQRLGPVILIVIIFGVFLSMACESFVAATHGEIASHFNKLWMGPWLLTAYGMGYSMMLPLVSRPEFSITSLKMSDKKKYGNLTERYGCKKLLLLAYGTFSVGCVMT